MCASLMTCLSILNMIYRIYTRHGPPENEAEVGGVFRSRRPVHMRETKVREQWGSGGPHLRDIETSFIHAPHLRRPRVFRRVNHRTATNPLNTLHSTALTVPTKM
jgi:hypothetical protein